MVMLRYTLCSAWTSDENGLGTSEEGQWGSQPKSLVIPSVPHYFHIRSPLTFKQYLYAV